MGGNRRRPYASHPSRVRGLKSRRGRRVKGPLNVAPFTGAWIEICNRGISSSDNTSHPSRVRGLKWQIAWLCKWQSPLSHPSRVRGLKSKKYNIQCQELLKSHPSRVRGLKSAGTGSYVHGAWSHPSRVRGLKSAPQSRLPVPRYCRTLHGCVD